MLVLGICLLVVPRPATSRLLLNLSPSVPVGLYLLRPRPPGVGALAVVRLPEPVRGLADARGYLAAGALLIKRVAAPHGRLACRQGAIVTLAGRAVALARANDGRGRPLPRWRGCRSLRGGRIFLLSSQMGSFDSRYFGPVAPRYVLGTALPLWAGASPCPGGRGAGHRQC
jgi:type IV secretory pathway protease TraF